jgi:hypothetical protein
MLLSTDGMSSLERWACCSRPAPARLSSADWVATETRVPLHRVMTGWLRREACPSIECRLGCYGDKSARPSSDDWVVDETRSLFSRDKIDPPGRQGHAAGPMHPGTIRWPPCLHRRRVAPLSDAPGTARATHMPRSPFQPWERPRRNQASVATRPPGRRVHSSGSECEASREAGCRCPRRTETCPGRDTEDCTYQFPGSGRRRRGASRHG